VPPEEEPDDEPEEGEGLLVEVPAEAGAVVELPAEGVELAPAAGVAVELLSFFDEA
jgi:hypothetical protein